MVTDDSMSSSIYIWHAMRICKVLLLHALKKRHSRYQAWIYFQLAEKFCNSTGHKWYISDQASVLPSTLKRKLLFHFSRSTQRARQTDSPHFTSPWQWPGHPATWHLQLAVFLHTWHSSGTPHTANPCSALMDESHGKLYRQKYGWKTGKLWFK